jgi:hypothetical protein
MGLRKNYIVEINGKLYGLQYFSSPRADDVFKKLEEIRLQGLLFRSIDDLTRWLEKNASDSNGPFIQAFRA